MIVLPRSMTEKSVQKSASAGSTKEGDKDSSTKLGKLSPDKAEKKEKHKHHDKHRRKTSDTDTSADTVAGGGDKDDRGKKKKDKTAEKGSIFGVPLKEILERENRGSNIPLLVERLTEWIQSKAINVEGIFRISAQHSNLDAMKLLLESGQVVNFDDYEKDPYSVCGLLQKYFRDLPKPLTSDDLHTAFITTHKSLEKLRGSGINEEEVAVMKFKGLVAMLAPENRDLIAFLLNFLAKVAEHEEKNKMGKRNLATVFGPLLLRSPDGLTMEQQLSESAMIPQIVENLMLYRDKIFAAPSTSRS